MTISSDFDLVSSDLLYINKSLKNEFENLSDSSLLLTGGAGFLGYYFVKSILFWNSINSSKSPIRLTVLDNFIRGIPDWFQPLLLDQNLSFLNHNIISILPNTLPPFDYIIHAASIASPTFYRQYPIQTMDANVIGLRNLLDYALELANTSTPLKSFLFFSTSEIYGDPPSQFIPTPESYRGNVSCTGPRACYDESKRYGETLCVNFASIYDLPIKIVRPFNNYGPGLNINDKRALPDFCKNILLDQDVTLLSDGSPTRTFCYITDAIIGYIKVLLHGTNGSPYNIGLDSPEISIKQLAELVVSTGNNLFDRNRSVIFALSSDSDYLVDNPNRRCPDISKARSEIGFNPTVDLQSGLTNSLLWYHKYNSPS